MTASMKTVANPLVLPTYARQNITFVRGEGCWLVADDGRRYLDFVAGIAVVGLGHCHPEAVAAAHSQIDRLWHVSNLYWTRPMAQLAERLSDRFGGAQAFFCNSGAEAVEAALKYARKATGRPGVVALEDSFHGRTLGALSVTGQPAKHQGFQPLLSDVTFVPREDVDALRAAVTEQTACVLLEPVLGEGGVHPLSPAFLKAAEDVASAAGALLALDEIQTGVGRTGSFFAFEQLGVRPQLVVLAKGLANGLPIGCLLVAEQALGGFVPGDHASTFGGNLVVTAVACAVVDAIDERLLGSVTELGARLTEGLEHLPGVRKVRGRGLLLGVELDRPAGKVVGSCLERGLLVSTAGAETLRLTPPLIVSRDEVDRALEILLETLS